ncbi:hypothetical protein BX666DRAFT_1924351 [Dichotomocladium elegans]|nr:hypothetical protein BX666DRAFT_1924351 [Dichotomocladium elegans]
MVAGSIVGGLVCIALLGGLLTWLNRRGGCTSPRRRRYNADQSNAIPDEFSIPMHDARRYIQPPSAQGYVSLQDPPVSLPHQQNQQQYQQQQQQQQQQQYHQHQLHDPIWDYKPNELYYTGPGQKPNVP